MLILWSPKFCYCYVVLPSHLSQQAKDVAAKGLAVAAKGLTFSNPIHKKSARNLNLYDFCHSPKKLPATQYQLAHIFMSYVNNGQLMLPS
jgi:hypothetical protein